MMNNFESDIEKLEKYYRDYMVLIKARERFSKSKENNPNLDLEIIEAYKKIINEINESQIDVLFENETKEHLLEIEDIHAKLYLEKSSNLQRYNNFILKVSLQNIATTLERSEDYTHESLEKLFKETKIEIKNIKDQGEESTKKSEEKIKNVIELIDSEMDGIKIEYSKLDKDFARAYREIEKLKDNLFGFFGLIVGLLAFIFVNYQFISSAKDLGMGKMLMFMGIANVGLILGIFLILGVLSDLLGQPEKLKNSLKIMKSGWLLVGIITIIGLGFSIDLFDRSEKNLSIDKQIQAVQETQKRQYEELYSELNKKDVENGKLKNEIDSLRNEIENLKNKK